ncbi:ABC1 kinase family protein [Bacillus sp. FJAT-44742]|uniref:ABC1 kinase family protein n=1 Tax=Bacillus sp. FJAT-44742 TaxID=2014005 RepID=UPI000C234A1A|nr:AarF/ABC1/UbiB kinase family protein [Bacillus sp. FJAT-44742]
MALSRGLKHANRYRKIVATLTRHGFGYIIQEVGLFHVLSLPKRLAADSNKKETRSVGTRIRHVVEELGPTFIKLGQMISTRKDIFPPSIIQELEKLQDDVPPFPYEKAKKMIEEDMDTSIDEVFSEISEKPLAAASIGQVHWARLKTGEEVAVKISRPHIKEIVEKDIEILRDLARLLHQRFTWAQFYRLQDVIEEFVTAIRDEVDYFVEARNTDKVRKNMEEFERVVIPEIYEEFSTKRILTMSFFKGNKISELSESRSEVKKNALARSLADAFLHQVLIDGLFHSDPHPGNIIFLDEDRAAMLDFGQVGRLNKAMRYQFVSYVIAMTRKKPEEVADTIYEMAEIPEDINHDQFVDDVEYLLQKYYDRPFNQVRFGEAINDIFSMSHRYQIQIYKEYTLLAKAIITLESLLERLDPELSIVEVAEPYGKMLARDRLNPFTWLTKVGREGKRQQDILTDIPKELRDALRQIHKGVGIDVKIPTLNIFLNKMDKIVNRISFSITLLAFSIIMVGLIIGSTFGDQNSILVQLPVIEISFIVSFFMFLLLIYSILKSGRF